LDDELKEEIKKEFPSNITVHFFSSVTQKGIPQLKDQLWSLLNEEGSREA
jgi:GTP-binding protein